MESIDETKPRNVAQFMKAFEDAEWRLKALGDEDFLSRLEVPSAVLDGAIGAYLDVNMAPHLHRDLTASQRVVQVAALRTHPRLIAAIESAYRAAHLEHLQGVDHEEVT